MNLLGSLQYRTHGRLIFKSSTAKIPPIGVSVRIQKEKIGKISDIFGSIKQPWIVVKLDRPSQFFPSSSEYTWDKKVKKKYNKFKNQLINSKSTSRRKKDSMPNRN